MSNGLLFIVAGFAALAAGAVIQEWFHARLRKERRAGRRDVFDWQATERGEA